MLCIKDHDPVTLGRGNSWRLSEEFLSTCIRQDVGVWIWSLAIPLASRSYAQARLGHIDRGKERWEDSIQRSKTRCNYTERAKTTTTWRLIVCTPWHIVHHEAFETTAHEILLVVLLSENRKEVRELGDDAVGEAKSIGSRISPIRETFRGDQHSHPSFTRSDMGVPSIHENQ